MTTLQDEREDVLDQLYVLRWRVLERADDPRAQRILEAVERALMRLAG